MATKSPESAHPLRDRWRTFWKSERGAFLVSRSCFLVIVAAFAWFIGYLSGLATQPFLGLTTTALFAFGALLLSLFRLSETEDPKRAAVALLALAPQSHPVFFMLSVVLFCGACWWGLQQGVDRRGVRDTLAVHAEIKGLNLSGDERLLSLLLLKRLHELGFSSEERASVIADLGEAVTADAFSYSHSEAHKDERNPVGELGAAYSASNDYLASDASAADRLYQLQMAVYGFLGKASHGRYHRLENMLRLVSADRVGEDGRANGLIGSLGQSREIALTHKMENVYKPEFVNPPVRPPGLEADPQNELKSAPLLPQTPDTSSESLDPDFSKPGDYQQVPLNVPYLPMPPAEGENLDAR